MFSLGGHCTPDNGGNRARYVYDGVCGLLVMYAVVREGLTRM